MSSLDFCLKVILASLKEFGSNPFLTILWESLHRIVAISELPMCCHNVVHNILLIFSVFEGSVVMSSFSILIW